jgi:hypothetical protein
MVPIGLALLAASAYRPVVQAARTDGLTLDLRGAPIEDSLGVVLGNREIAYNTDALRRARPVTITLKDVAPKEAVAAISRAARVPITLTDKEVVVGPEDRSIPPAPQLDTRLYGQTQFLPNSVAALRVVALRHEDSAPVNGASVLVTLTRNAEPGPKGSPGFATTVYQGKTDASGTAGASFRMPNLPAGSYGLSVTTVALGERDRVTQGITIAPSAQVLLTTDKPVYQPGQVIHIRALALSSPDRSAVAGADGVIDVRDGKGNMVFKHRDRSSAYGIFSADFQLANELNMGGFKVTATIAGVSQEKTVTVDRYVLPKYKVGFKPDKTWYRPGDTLTGAISAQYFFGKPVAGTVKVALSTFDAGFNQFAEVNGTLDNSGHFRVEQKLPEFFAGQPLEQGNAFVKAEITVTDTADHDEKATSNVPVAAQAIKVTIVPESPTPVPNVENRAYIVTSAPDGSPVKTQYHLSLGGGFSTSTIDGETDDSGVALVRYSVPSTAQGLQVTVRDANGATGAATAALNAPDAEAILLHADGALNRVGETLHLTAISPQGKSPVYFDIMRNRQTVLTKTAELEAGRAEVSVSLGPDLSGTLEIHAYRIGHDGNIRRDTRVVYVDPANDLRIAATPDKETYLPGEPAKVRFAVTGPDGRPRPSALGVSIVDESVFALQEMQPGMEKVYFLLEKEILEPRYEIHGMSPSEIVRPVPTGAVGAVRQRAAGALFASLPRRDDAVAMLADSYPAKLAAARERGFNLVADDAEAIRQAMNAYEKAHKAYPTLSGDALMVLVLDGRLARPKTIDPWKHDYTISAVSQSYKDGFTLHSFGPDGKAHTEDDIDIYVWLSQSVKDTMFRDRDQMAWAARGGGFGGRGFGGVRRGMVVDGAVAFDRPAAAPMPMLLGLEKNRLVPEGIKTAFAYQEDNSAVTAAPARVREYFPETLLFQPSLITDNNGRASLDVPMADSITTWRLTAMASTRNGAMGSVTAPMRVFQDFFVDINFPVQLTQGDEVSVPVSVYNYLPRAQKVTLTADKEGWFQLMDDAAKTVSLGPNEVKGVKYRVKVTGLGFQKLTIRAQGTSRSDAVRREVEVIPNGKRVEQAFNGRLTETVHQTVRIPEGSVAGASNILVKVYPGVFSTVVEGMDNIFRMPFGCFEQTSSTTYPNVLVLDYMKRTNKITPEIRMKAEQYINLGYQRLLSFEVQGGGFSWFGTPPANKVLTAFGLQEFADMSGVWDVDKNVLSRTQVWEASQQNPDGSWAPDANYIDEGLGPMWKSNLLATAYVTWGLAESNRIVDGAPGTAGKGVNYLKTHQSEALDAYALAILANAMLTAAPNDPAGTTITDRLVKERTDDPNGMTYWKTGQATVTFAGGDSANIETTALAALACIKSGRYPDVVGRALNWLISKRDPSGTWGSTQATILTLRALLAGQGAQVHKGSATIKVLVNGSEAGTVKVTDDNADVMQQVDCREYVRAGDNDVELQVSGEGQMMYGISAWHYTPWGGQGAEKGPLDIEVKYDRTQLAVNETLKADVKITFTPPVMLAGELVGMGIRNLPPAKYANMVVVDLGVPPGFVVDQNDLIGLVEAKTITRFELTGRQIILYFDRIEANKPVTFSVHMAAQYPLRAQTPQSVVYQYYNPGIRATASPVGLQVTDK